jgi:hypothetical protein
MRLIPIALLKFEKGIPWHPQHVRKLARQGKFPKPIRCGHLTCFDEQEIEAFLEGLKAARDSGPEVT